MAGSMGSLIRSGVGLAFAAAAALVFTAVQPQTARAEGAVPVANTDLSQANALTDVSASARTRRRARYVYRNNNAAGLAFMGLALGTVGAVIAEQRRRDYYRDQYFYGGPAYYGRQYYGDPAYYGGPYYSYYYYGY